MYGMPSLHLSLGTVWSWDVLVKMFRGLLGRGLERTSPTSRAQRGRRKASWGPEDPSIPMRLSEGGGKAEAPGAQRIVKGDLEGRD